MWPSVSRPRLRTCWALGSVSGVSGVFVLTKAALRASLHLWEVATNLTYLHDFLKGKEKKKEIDGFDAQGVFIGVSFEFPPLSSQWEIRSSLNIQPEDARP